jgi:hypothetical protein
MKTHILSCAFFAGCLVVSATGQTPAIVNGHKVLVDKLGNIVTPPRVATLPGAPLVGGADSCVTPDLVSGLGSFAFDNTIATTGPQGQTEAPCNAYGTTGIDNDVWFTWVAPYTGGLRIDTCAGSNDDTKIAAYPGSTCPTTGSALACNDDSCSFSLQSSITIAVTSGNSYVIQMGDFPGATGGTGTFALTQVAPPPPPPANDDCSAAQVLAGPGTYAFDITSATTSFQQSFNCATAEKDVWFQYAATTTGSAIATTCGLVTSIDNDTVMAVYAGSGCPSGNEIDCNDDTCGLESMINWPTTCGQTYMIQLGAFDTSYDIAGSFSVAETGTQCGPTGTPFCFGDGSGTACPCGNSGAAGNGCASSVNANGANLSTTGASTLASDTLVLHGTGMPNSTCLYFQGTSQISTIFGDGLRCAGGTIVRLGTKTNAGGASQYPAGGDPSVHVKGAVTAPGTRTYQVWYRNAAPFCSPSTFNLTNGMLVTWQ